MENALSRAARITAESALGNAGRALPSAALASTVTAAAPIDNAFFVQKYNEDAANKEEQKLTEYLEEVDTFYEGAWGQPGWNELSASLLKKVTDKKKEGEGKDANSVVKEKLEILGKTIGAEWAKDNDVRKIDTDALKAWGDRMKEALKKDDGSGAVILKLLKSVEGEVAAKLAKKPGEKK